MITAVLLNTARRKPSISAKRVNSTSVLLKVTITLGSGILPNVITTEDTLSIGKSAFFMHLFGILD